MEYLVQQFNMRFRDTHKLKHVISPLRICHLGAHVDHQHGLVTGMTLDANIKMAYSCNEDGLVRAQSLEFPGKSPIVNYESGCPELITIYNILKETPGVYGARFSGAGYRGCCIGFVDPKFKDIIKESIDRLYPIEHPKYRDVYDVYYCKTDGGARIL